MKLERENALKTTLTIGTYVFHEHKEDKRSFTCVNCGNLVSEDYARKHADFHKLLKKLGE